MFDRLELLIGKEALNKLKTKHIVVLGLGGVGGYVVESLIRSGISNITIIDSDSVSITNFNRQIIAINNNIGKLKVEAFEERIKSINSDVKVEKINKFINKENIDSIISKDIDYFIDACDTVSTKKLVIEKCIKNNIKYIVCLGTGKRVDPSKIIVTDIRKTSYDPIAKILRKHVNNLNIKEKVICCYSKEIPKKINSDDITSMMFVPSVAGITIASYVINDLIKE